MKKVNYAKRLTVKTILLFFLSSGANSASQNYHNVSGTAAEAAGATAMIALVDLAVIALLIFIVKDIIAIVRARRAKRLINNTLKDKSMTPATKSIPANKSQTWKEQSDKMHEIMLDKFRKSKITK